MMDAPIEVSGSVAATPLRVYEAFLDPQAHAEMTGAPATTAEDGGFTAWGGYISGRTQHVVPGKKIVQAWRTTDFPQDAPDSILEVHLEPCVGGTRVTFRHRDIPSGQGPNYARGWVEHYLDPMVEWFGAL